MELRNGKYNGVLNIATVIIVAAGGLGQMLLYWILGIQVGDVPVVTKIVLWFAISGIVKELFENVL